MKKTHSTKPHADEHQHHHCEFLSDACEGSITLRSLQRVLSEDISYLPHLGEIDFVASGATLPSGINQAQRQRIEQLRVYLEKPKYLAALQYAAEAVRYSNYATGIRDHHSNE